MEQEQDIESKYQTLLEELDAMQKERNAFLEERKTFLQKVADLEASQAELQNRVQQLLRQLYGKKTERIVAESSSQPYLPGMEPPAPEAKAPEKKTHVGAHERAAKKGQPAAGWNEFPEELPREEVTLDVPESERKGLVKMGEQVSQRLMRRSSYYVKVIRRLLYGEPGCAGTGIVAAKSLPVPSCLAPDSDRCHYDASVVAHVIAAKIVDHIPFYRQEQGFLRMKIRYGRAAMSEQVARVSRALALLHRRMCQIVLECPVLHADETRVTMLDPEAGRGKARTCWIWARRTGVGPPLTVFHFSRDRSGETARNLLGDYKGTIIRDACAGYSTLQAEVAACWAHVRRKFFEAREGAGGESARRALDIIRNLYHAEGLAKEKAAEEVRRKAPEKEEKAFEDALFAERRKIRRHSASQADDFFALCRSIQEKFPPKSPAAAAAAHALGREKELRRFLADPRLNIDNNPCENVIRPFCIGRKNWLFAGSQKGGVSLAVLAGFAATCKENAVDFEKWLLDVMERLDTTPAEDIDCLLPHLWKKDQEKT